MRISEMNDPEKGYKRVEIDFKPFNGEDSYKTLAYLHESGLCIIKLLWPSGLGCYYSITHRMSGYRIFDTFNKLKHAKAMLEYAASFPVDYKACPAIVREQFCEHGPKFYDTQAKRREILAAK